MTVIYFKRYRMEFDLTAPMFEPPPFPNGYSFLSWDESLLELHADTKYRCFSHEIDSNVFPCLGEEEGCLRLMTEIARRDGFLEEATWLIQYHRPGSPHLEFCGTIQGIEDSNGLGSIQNVGITPGHRGCGLGSWLLFNALNGFRDAGLTRAWLEVTAKNSGAIRLYERLGFRKVKTVYKAAEVAYA